MNTNDNKRIRVEMNADGTQNIVSPDGQVLDTITPGTPDIDISPAMAALRELQQEDVTPIIRSVHAGGREWFIRRLNWAGLTKLGMYTPRDGEGVLDLTSEDTANSLLASMLATAVVTGRTDPTPFFANFQEAHRFARDTSPKVATVLGTLFHAILAHNPQLLPEAKREPIAFDDEELVEKKEMS